MNSHFKYRIIFVIFLALLKISSVYGATKTAQTVGQFAYNSANVWTPSGIPASTDDVIISKSTLLASSYNVAVKSMNISDTAGDAAIFYTDSTVTVTNGIYIYPMGEIYLAGNIQGAQRVFTVGTSATTSYDLNVYGAFYSHVGSNYITDGNHRFYLRAGGIVLVDAGSALYLNGASTVSNSDTASAELINNGTLYFGSSETLLAGDTYFLSGSVTYFLGTSYVACVNTGTLTMTNAGAAAFSNFLWENSCNMTIQSKSYFKMQSDDPQVPIYYELHDNAFAKIVDSDIFFNSTILNTLSASILFAQNSTITTNSYITQFETSQIQLVDSTLTTTGPIVIINSTLLYASGSTISLTDNVLAMQNSSRFLTYGSQVNFTVSEAANSLLGIFDSSLLAFYEDSQFYLNGHFISYDQSTILVDHSNFTVANIFFLDDNAIMSVTNGSIIDILNIFAVRHNANFQLHDSILNVQSNITFYNTSSFNFTDSYVSVDGLFSYLNDNNASSPITNTKVDVNGFFENSGYIEMTNSELNVYTNYTTWGLFVLNNSNITVETGGFYAYNQFKGSNSNIKVNSATITIENNAYFDCVNCSITIVGTLQQGTGASVNLHNTQISNLASGQVEVNGVINLEGSGITNMGQFDLRSDILPSSSSENTVDNSGVFSINGAAPSNINANFKNSGQVKIQQQTTVSQLTQTDGSIDLQSTTLSSGSDIGLDGGYISGNGSINSNLVNSKGTVGKNRNIDSLNINGNYTQGSDATLTITIDSVGNSSIININGTANLNGTLIIKVEEGVINSNTNVTVSVVTHTDVSGTFQNTVIITYNRDTQTETTVTNNCKVSTSHDGSRFALLVSPDTVCVTSSGAEEIISTSSKSGSISKGAIIGIVVGVVGAAGIVCAVYFFRKKSDWSTFEKKMSSFNSSTAPPPPPSSNLNA